MGGANSSYVFIHCASNNQKTYSVQLFPKETCNCPSTTTCWHIIAVKLSVGNHNILTTKRTLNQSQLK